MWCKGDWNVPVYNLGRWPKNTDGAQSLRETGTGLGRPFSVTLVLDVHPYPQVNGVIVKALQSNKVSNDQGWALNWAMLGLGCTHAGDAIRSRVLAWWRKQQLPSGVQLFVTPRTVACQAPLSMGFSRQEYWSGSSFWSPGHRLDPGIECGSISGRCITAWAPSAAARR